MHLQFFRVFYFLEIRWYYISVVHFQSHSLPLPNGCDWLNVFIIENRIFLWTFERFKFGFQGSLEGIITMRNGFSRSMIALFFLPPPVRAAAFEYSAPHVPAL